MRILVIATHINVPGSGGGQTHVSELVASLRRHAPTLLLARRGSSGKDVVGAGLWPRLPPKGLAHIISAANLVTSLPAVLKFKPTVIYERGSSYGLGTYLSLILRAPLLVMLLDEHISPFSLMRARRIISTNPELVPSLFRQKAVKVSWGANTDRFHPDIDPAPARRELGLQNETVIAYTGTLQPWHGIEYLIEAAALLKDRPLRFLMIGGRPDRLEKVQNAARELGVEERFTFTGQVSYDRVPGLLAVADICVAPFDPQGHSISRRRGYSLDPLKLFEYLAMAKPTITIRAENIEALFRDREHLCLVSPRDSAALADAIAWVCDHPEDAEKMAKKGWELIVSKHTWQSHADHLVQIFDEMLKE